MDDKQLQRMLNNTIVTLQLDLSGRTVLTEAASGPYCVTPLIAALSGADVLAFGKTSRYGTSSQMFSLIKEKMKMLGISSVDFIDTLTPEVIGKADLITNSGHLRPLNEEKLRHAKPGCVIALMYEAWELRDEDIDVAYCRQADIPIVAVNERHPNVGVFDFLGEMAAQLIREVDIEVAGGRFVVLCNNEFGPYIARTLIDRGATVGVVDLVEHVDDYVLDIQWLSVFPQLPDHSSFGDCDGVIFTAYPFDQMWIGDDGPIAVEDLKKAFGNPMIFRFAGDVSTAALDKADVEYYPKRVQSGHMGILPSALGYEPIIRLQAGGLKAAQAMLAGEECYRNVVIGQRL